ncbi:MAG: EAL domain-containing protein [Candidatus Nanopelagicales bacterium]|nr:EAL domain-containing protein [Candidatus Nanopelagicales bacterium]
MVNDASLHTPLFPSDLPLESGALPWRLVTTVVCLVVVAASAITVVQDGAPWLSSLLLTLLCVSLIINVWLPVNAWGRKLGSIAAMAAGGMASALIVTFLVGVPAQDPPLPSPYTALSILLLSVAILTLDLTSTAGTVVSATAILSAALIPVLALLRTQPDLSPVDPLYAATIPLSSAMLILLVALAAVASRPHRMPLGPLSESGALPFAILAVVAVLASWGLTAILETTWLDQVEPRITTTIIVLTQFLIFAVLMTASLALAQRHERERSARIRESGADEAFVTLTTRSDVGFARVAGDGAIEFVNDALVHFLGRSQEDLLGHHWTTLNAGLTSALADATSTRLSFSRPDGATVWGDVVVNRTSHEDDLVLQIVDATEEQELAASMAWRAGHDDVTGCLSRFAILRQLDARRTEEPTESSALVIVDLDRFHLVNEALGQPAGDSLLASVGALIRDAAGPDHAVGRLHSDTFLILGPEGSGESSLALAGQLTAEIATMDLSSLSIRMTACAGSTTTWLKESDDDPQAQAIAALAMAKEQGPGSIAEFTSDMRVRARESLATLAELRALLSAGNPDQALDFWFQPIVDLSTHEVAGFETLARWNHPERGLLTAGEFILDAEQDVDVISWIASDSLRAAARFSQALGGDQRVTVNLSGRQIASTPHLTAFATEALALALQPRVLLGIEITETVATRLTAEARRQLERMVRAGCMLYLDDFGAGYSSIANLRDLPIGTIKLDREYAVAAMVPGPAYSVARGMAALATSMGVRSLVEGLEDESMVSTLVSAGWQYGQGWYLGMPGPGSNFTP